MSLFDRQPEDIDRTPNESDVIETQSSPVIGTTVKSSAELAGATTPRATKPETEKKATKKDVADLLASFKPSAPPEPTAAEKARADRQQRLIALTAAFAEALANLGIESGETNKAIATLKAFGNTVRHAAAAIESIPDSKLVEPEKTETKPRSARATAAAKTASELPGKGPDEIDAEIRLRRAEREAAAAEALGVTDESTTEDEF